MESANQVLPANVNNGVDQCHSTKDLRLLDRVAKLWGDHAERDLGTRHQTGRLLNERLGSPDERLPHARRVLKMVAKRLGIAESDLNRMRWFAHRFVDVAAFRKQHPEVVNWTGVKEVLPSLKPAKGGKARVPSANPSRPALRGVVKSCTNLASKLIGLDFEPGEAERDEFLDAFRLLA